MQMNTKWVERYFKLSKEISTWSKDPSTKIGAIIVGDSGQIISQGYNGFPRNVDDNDFRYQQREIKYQFVIHAEMNAILNALYNGASVKGCTLFVYGLPVCNECAKAVIQAGIKSVYILIDEEHTVGNKWKESFKISETMFKVAGISFFIKIDNKWVTDFSL